MTGPDEREWDAPAHFTVQVITPLARDGQEWLVAVQAGVDQSVTVAYDEDSRDAVAQMEQFVERAQAALTELRRTIADNTPRCCQRRNGLPEHAEPEEVSLGFGGITYRCARCGAEWFRPIRPGEPV